MTLSGKGRREKGLRFQRLIRDWFEEAGFQPLARPGGEDGDDLKLLGMPWFSIELKGSSQPRLPEWIKQANAQAGEAIPVLIWKRHGRGSPGDQWVTMELAEFTRLLILLRQHRQANDVLANALAGSFEGALQRAVVGDEPDHLIPLTDQP